MARELVIRIIGDSDSLERSLRKSQRSVDTFGKRMSRSLGPAGIAAGAALGAGLLVGLKNSTDAAIEAQAVLGQTRVALGNVGKSWDTYGARIQKTTTDLSRLAAVNDEDLLKSFTLLLRGTKDVNKALELNATAANLARGRNMDLVSAATLLVKVNAGQLGSARRLGIQIDANATSQQALAEITRRYAGAAEQYGRSAAGAQDRFKVAIGELQEAIGQELLPIVTKYLTKGSKWLENTENTEKITRTLEGTLAVTSATLSVFADTAGVAAAGLEKIGSAWDRLPDFGKDKGLFDLLNLPGRNTGVLELLGLTGGGNGLKGAAGGGGNFDQLGNAIRDRIAAGTAGGGRAGQSAHELAVLAEKTAVKSNDWFDARIARMLGRASDPESLRDQIGNLRTISGLLSQRLAATKDITRRLKLEDQIADIAVQIRGREQEISATAADASRRASAAAEDAKRKRLEGIVAGLRLPTLGVDGGLTVGDVNKSINARDNAALFRALGLTSEGGERAPTVKGLQGLLGNLERDAKGTVLDTPKLRAKFENIGKVISASFGQAREDVRRTIKGMLDDIDQQLGDRTGPSGFRHASPNKLAAALGFEGTDARRRAAAILSQIGPGGSVPRGSALAGSGTTIVMNNPQFSGINDLGKFEAAVARKAAARPRRRRGAR